MKCYRRKAQSPLASVQCAECTAKLSIAEEEALKKGMEE